MVLTQLCGQYVWKCLTFYMTKHTNRKSMDNIHSSHDSCTQMAPWMRYYNEWLVQKPTINLLIRLTTIDSAWTPALISSCNNSFTILCLWKNKKIKWTKRTCLEDVLHVTYVFNACNIEFIAYKRVEHFNIWHSKSTSSLITE